MNVLFSSWQGRASSKSDTFLIENQVIPSSLPPGVRSHLLVKKVIPGLHVDRVDLPALIISTLGGNHNYNWIFLQHYIKHIPPVGQSPQPQCQVEGRKSVADQSGVECLAEPGVYISNVIVRRLSSPLSCIEGGQARLLNNSAVRVIRLCWWKKWLGRRHIQNNVHHLTTFIAHITN